MKIDNITIRAYSEPELKENSTKDDQEKKNKNVINGAELNLNASATEKRITQERRALKVKLDQMVSDDEYAQEMSAHLEREAELKKDSLDSRNEAKAIEDVKKTVKEAYGVEDSSEEQQKLEEIEALREKQKSGAVLTDEEWERLNKTDDLTDYQKLMLEYDDAIDEYTKRAEDSERLAQAYGNAVNSMKQALLEGHPMVDASKEANEMIKNALKEEQSTLLAEMKENYDEKVEEEKEEAEEAREKKEELHNDSKEETPGEQLEAILEAATDVERQRTSKKNNLLLEEDLKGIEVDESV